MCKAIDDMIADARNEGISQGISQGIFQGIREGREEMLRELIQKKLVRNLDVESIAKELEMDVEAVRKIAEELKEAE